MEGTKILGVLVAGCCGLACADLDAIVGSVDDARTSADAGPVDRGAGDAPATASGPCRSNSDCRADQVCSLDGCTVAQCGMPSLPAVGGPSLYGACDGASCGPGLVCLAATTVTQVPVRHARGVCLQACDPCAPSCADGNSCLQLGRATVGGACVRGVAGDFEPCDSTKGIVCPAGSICWEGHCHGRCTGDRPLIARRNQVTTSEDCSEGQFCELAAEVDGEQDLAVCVAVLAIAIGERITCGSDGLGRPRCGGQRCLAPSVPLGGPLGDLPPFICSPPDCATSGCGDSDLVCFPAQSSSGVPRCVADGVLQAGDFCHASRNCAVGLSCSMDSTELVPTCR